MLRYCHGAAETIFTSVRLHVPHALRLGHNDSDIISFGYEDVDPSIWGSSALSFPSRRASRP
eukprot:15427861-Heterocapsa_arctica.AAC.1